MSRVALLLLALALTGCTYTATSYRVRDEPVEERVVRVLEVLEAVRAGPPEVTINLGVAPDTTALTLRASLRKRCRVALARRPRKEVRQAESTYVPRRRVLKHVLAYTLGLPVLAPVWLPMYYHGCAEERAEAAASNTALAGQQWDDDGGCFVTRVDVAQTAGDWVEDATPVEREVTQPAAPLRGVPVRVRRADGGWTWIGRTDPFGRLSLPRRVLGGSDRALHVDVDDTQVVVFVPRSSWSPPAPAPPVEIEAAIAAQGLETVVRRLATAVGSGALAPDAVGPRTLPALLRRRGGPLPLAPEARGAVDAAARALTAGLTGQDLAPFRADLEAARRAAPECWEVHRLLGTTARLAGDERGAIHHLEVALRLLPETSPIAERIATELLPR